VEEGVTGGGVGVKAGCGGWAEEVKASWKGHWVRFGVH
jgi:hypothetical protein